MKKAIINIVLLVALILMNSACTVRVTTPPASANIEPEWPYNTRTGKPVTFVENPWQKEGPAHQGYVEMVGNITTNKSVTLLNGYKGVKRVQVGTTQCLVRGTFTNQMYWVPATADLQAWTDLVIERLGKELETRGVEVVEKNGDLVVNIMVDKLNWVWLTSFGRRKKYVTVVIKVAQEEWSSTITREIRTPKHEVEMLRWTVYLASGAALKDIAERVEKVKG